MGKITHEQIRQLIQDPTGGRKHKIRIVVEVKCLRCGHQWFPRYEGKKPKFCAKCNSPYWDKPRQK